MSTQPDCSKIAMVGTAPSSRLLAPFADPTWQIWACSPDNMRGLSRVDAWFELHDLGYPEYQASLRPYVQWLREQTFTVYAQDQRYIPNATPFPKDEMIGHFGRRFFTSSFAWMFALALTKGVKEIGLYGIDMAASDEYRQQRPGVHHFIEIAEASGVTITVPYESEILQPPPLYGYDRNSARVRKLEVIRHELTEKLAYARRMRADLEKRVCMLRGALDQTLVDDIAKQGREAAKAKLEEMQASHRQLDFHEAKILGSRDSVDYMLSIWCADDVSRTHSVEAPAVDYGGVPERYVFEPGHPYDIIAQKSLKARGQPIPYQEDEPWVAEPSLLAGFDELPVANGVLRNGHLNPDVEVMP